MSDWKTDRPDGEWQELGGGYPLDKLPTCPECGKKPGKACHIVVVSHKHLPKDSYVRFINGDTSRFPSIHTSRWELVRELSSSVRGCVTIPATNNAQKGKKEKVTMAKTVTVKRSGTKSTSKAKAAPKAKPAAKKTGGGSRRSHEDLVKLVPAIVKARKAGKSWDDALSGTGINAIVARKLLAEGGYNAKGESLSVEAITGSGKSLAGKIAKARKAGQSWYLLAQATGKSEADIKSLLEEHGHSDLLTGRVYGEAGGR